MMIRAFSIIALLTMTAGSAFAVKPDIAGFRSGVAPLLERYCVDCHGPGFAEGGLALHDIDADLLVGEDFENWRLVEERIAFGEMPPADADQPTASERQALLGWIRRELTKTMLPGAVTHQKLFLPQYGNYVDHQLLFGERRGHVTPAPPRLWRLRPEIYDSTIPGLGERVGGLANGLNTMDGSEFKDYAAAYFIDEAAMTPLLGNARKIAAALVSGRSKDRIFREMVDEEKGAPNADKVREAVRYAFRKVLDRNPTAGEVERFAAFYDKARATADCKVAARALLTAVLMQPDVLFRQELGDGKLDRHGRLRLSQREVAFALSYALDNEPIGNFFRAAEAGRLATPEQVAELVRNQLQNDSKEQNRNPRVMQFFREYFNYPFAEEVFKDQPEGGDHQPDRLVRDLELTIRGILRSDEDVLKRLLTTRDYYVDVQYREDRKNRGQVLLARGHHKWSFYHTSYNLPRDWKWSAERQPLKFPEDERAGVLTHPAWLAAWSGNFENHPVQRGRWIRTHLLGGTVPDVPIGVDARVPEKEHTTFRDRLRAATSAAECWRCHRKMDPLGVTFERYDLYGRYQRLDAGQPVNASGRIDRTRIPELDGTTVAGPTELMEVLSESEYVEQVFVRHVFRYLMGRNETLGDANTLQDAHGAYRDSGGSFRELIVSILSSDSFLLRVPATRSGSPS